MVSIPLPLPVRKWSFFLPGSDAPLPRSEQLSRLHLSLSPRISLELDPECGILRSRPWFGSCREGREGHFGFSREERKILSDPEALGSPRGGDARIQRITPAYSCSRTAGTGNPLQRGLLAPFYRLVGLRGALYGSTTGEDCVVF